MFEFESGFEGADGDFELLVVGFLRGDALHEEAGGDEDFYEWVGGVFGAPFQNFIRDAADEWEPGETQEEVGEEGVLFWQEHVGENGDDENDDDETRAAARVETGLLLGVFYREVEIFLVGPNGFVLSSVVLEDAFHFFRKKHKREISHKDAELDDAVDEVEEEVVICDDGEDFLELGGDEDRKSVV